MNPVLSLALIFTTPVIGVALGALAGWVVGLFFGTTILGTLSHFGVNTSDLAMWELGAMLGFVGGFFKAMLIIEKD